MKTPFEKLTKSQQRVSIARDVLAQLATRFRATTGVWVSKTSQGDFNLGKDPNAEVCDITRKHRKCNVCAMGALFVAAVERADRLKASELSAFVMPETAWYPQGIQETDVFSYMSRFFDEDQLDAIEAAFERGQGAREHDEADEFCIGESDPTTRMRLIMENIVANKGRFNWKRKPVASYVTPGYEP